MTTDTIYTGLRRQSRPSHVGNKHPNRSREMEVKFRRRRLVAGVAFLALVATGVIAGVTKSGDNEVEAKAQNYLSNRSANEKISNIEISELPPLSAKDVIPEQTESIEPAADLPEATVEILQAQLPLIEELKPLYQEAAEAVNLPWQVGATLHYREGRNHADRSMLSGEKLGTINPDSHQVAPTNQLENYIAALKHFKAMAKSVYGIDIGFNSTREEWKKAFLAWNRGDMYNEAEEQTGQEWGPDKSPYVVNGLKGHENMRWPSKGQYDPDGISWGEPASLHGKVETGAGAVATMEFLNDIYFTFPEQ